MQGDNVGTALPTNGPSDDLNRQTSAAACSLSKCTSGNDENWMVVSTSGDNPAPRAHHAAAVVGGRMVVVGGESGKEMLDDTQVLSLEKLTWAVATPKAYIPNGLPLKIPACKGHSLVPWGKRVLLVGGKTEPSNDKVSVWSFDTDTECWSFLEAKGDIPVSRGGHTVVRAGPVLILFGGEDAKGKKLNDLHMFDLKSSMWLPLHYTGTGPSPRCNHVASLYDDKILFVFGGQSNSRILNDLYSLDFETMVWSRIKVLGHHPPPRAGCCGVLCGTKWYITGGGSKKKRFAETLVFDVLKHEMSVVAVSSHPTSIIANKGFTVVSVHHKDRIFFVAFGGMKKDPSNKLEILIVEKENSMSWRSAADNPSISESGVTEFVSHLKSNAASSSTNSALRHGLASPIEHEHPARRSLSESKMDPNSRSGGASLRKQFHHDDHSSVINIHKSLDDEKVKESEDCLQVSEQRNKVQETVVTMDTASSITNTDEGSLFLEPESSSCYQNLHRASDSLLPDSDDAASPGQDGKQILCAPLNVSQLYETKIAALVRKNVHLEGQLATALVSRENAEKNLPSLLKSKQELERSLGDAMKEVEVLKEKLAGAELAQEEANGISNMVHSDNVKLEHDVAFLKAVLEDTQKELHSTRGVLAGERARAFQLQVEVFHLKQRLQSLENRTPTPRKQFQI